MVLTGSSRETSAASTIAIRQTSRIDLGAESASNPSIFPKEASLHVSTGMENRQPGTGTRYEGIWFRASCRFRLRTQKRTDTKDDAARPELFQAVPN